MQILLGYKLPIMAGGSLLNWSHENKRFQLPGTALVDWDSFWGY